MKTTSFLGISGASKALQKLQLTQVAEAIFSKTPGLLKTALVTGVLAAALVNPLSAAAAETEIDMSTLAITAADTGASTFVKEVGGGFKGAFFGVLGVGEALVGGAGSLFDWVSDELTDDSSISSADFPKKMFLADSKGNLNSIDSLELSEIRALVDKGAGVTYSTEDGSYHRLTSDFLGKIEALVQSQTPENIQVVQSTGVHVSSVATAVVPRITPKNSKRIFDVETQSSFIDKALAVSATAASEIENWSSETITTALQTATPTPVPSAAIDTSMSDLLLSTIAADTGSSTLDRVTQMLHSKPTLAELTAEQHVLQTNISDVTMEMMKASNTTSRTALLKDLETLVIEMDAVEADLSMVATLTNVIEKSSITPAVAASRTKTVR